MSLGLQGLCLQTAGPEGKVSLHGSCSLYSPSSCPSHRRDPCDSLSHSQPDLTPEHVRTAGICSAGVSYCPGLRGLLQLLCSQDDLKLFAQGLGVQVCSPTPLCVMPGMNTAVAHALSRPTHPASPICSHDCKDRMSRARRGRSQKPQTGPVEQ